MVSQTTKIINKSGFHMTPANTFVSTMSKYKSNVDLIFGDKRINGKSIMNVIGACMKCGTELTIECSGPDEQEMLDKAISLIESGFGEEE